MAQYGQDAEVKVYTMFFRNFNEGEQLSDFSVFYLPGAYLQWGLILNVHPWMTAFSAVGSDLEGTSLDDSFSAVGSDLKGTSLDDSFSAVGSDLEGTSLDDSFSAVGSDLKCTYIPG